MYQQQTNEKIKFKNTILATKYQIFRENKRYIKFITKHC